MLNTIMSKMITVTIIGVDADGYPNNDIIKSILLNADNIFIIEDSDMNNEFEITKITFIHTNKPLYVRESKEELSIIINK